jgi:extradiol dioxygenase family protein
MFPSLQNQSGYALQRRGCRGTVCSGVSDMSTRLTPFHIAVQVRDIAEARRFYGELLGCSEGRSAASWVDFNLYGHQFVCHLNPTLGKSGKLTSHYNPVDGQGVPVPHYGIVLELSDWDELAGRLKERGVQFVIGPCIRFKDQPGEQATLFFLDPTGNALEFKALKDIQGQLFAT